MTTGHMSPGHSTPLVPLCPLAHPCAWWPRRRWVCSGGFPPADWGRAGTLWWHLDGAPWGWSPIWGELSDDAPVRKASLGGGVQMVVADPRGLSSRHHA